MTNANEESFVPKVDPLYVKFGNHNDLKTIIGSNRFYPAFITGLSGNGKTFMVEQICAELNRELFRVNITIETDEDDLLGGFRLVDGSTKWFEASVIKAMQHGAILLLDEVDLASFKIMCLQPVLEGKGIFLKKINKFVEPKPGFNIIATANTKGQGSDSGKFIGTNILNEAFLERFPETFEQEYPKDSVERDILRKVFELNDVEDDVYIETLLTWANSVRKTYDTEAVSDIISTRRLVHIAHAYAMFRDRKKAIDVCISRFDETTKAAFKELYNRYEAKPEEVKVETKKEVKKDKKVPEATGLDFNAILGTNINPADILDKVK